MKTNNLINILAITSAIILAGCSAGLEEEKSSGSVSTFMASNVSPSAARHIADQSWGVPAKTSFVATTCLQDNAYGKSIVGQRFEVTGDNVTEEVVSNEKGCIQWNDFVRFDYFAAQKFIPVKRTITGLGDFTGELDINFEIDPWNKEIRSIKESNLFASAASVVPGKTLFVASSALKLRPTAQLNNRAVLEGQVTLTPKFERYTSEGTSAEIGSFKKGEFNVTVILFEQSIHGDRKAISTPFSFEASINDDSKLVSDVAIEMFDLPSVSNDVELKLGVRISPVGTTAPKFLDNAEAMVTIAKNSFNVVGTMETTNLPAFNFATVVEKSASSLDGESKFGLKLKTPVVTFNGYVNEYSASVKAMRTMIKTCILNAVTNTKVEELPFVVRILDENKDEIFASKEKNANTDGCITTYFVEKYNLDAKRDSNWKKRYVQIEGVDGTYKGSVKSREFYINPWETANFSHTIEGELPPSYNSVQESKLYTSDLSLQFIKNEESYYRLNKQMDMSFVKKFKVEFRPKVNRGFKHSGDNGYEPLYTGKLNMRLMVLYPKKNLSAPVLEKLLDESGAGAAQLISSNIEDFDFISGVKGQVEIVDGRVAHTVKLKFDTNSAKYMTARTYIVAEFSSADEESALQPVIVSIPANLSSLFRASSDTVTSETAINLSAKEIKRSSLLNNYFAKIDSIDLNKAPVSPWKVNSFDLFEQLLNSNEKLTTVRGIDKVTFMSWTKGKAINTRVRRSLLSREDFDLIFKLNAGETDTSVYFKSPKQWLFGNKSEGKKLINKLCEYYYSGVNGKRTIWGNYVSDEGNCKAEPTKYLSFSGVKHVLAITEQPKRSYGSNVRTISVGTNNNASVGKNHSNSWGWRTSFGFKLSTFGLEKIGLGSSAGLDVSYSENWSNSESQGEGISFGETQSMEIEETVLEFKAKTRACVLLKAKGEKVRKGITKGLRICESEDKEESIRESWYIINEPWKWRASLADVGAQNDMRIFKLIRGQRKFKEFKDKVESANNGLFLRPIKARTEVTQYLGDLYQPADGSEAHLNEGYFPGLID